MGPDRTNTPLPHPRGRTAIPGLGAAALAAPGRSKPNPNPLRIAMGAGFLAVLSGTASAIITPPQRAVGPAGPGSGDSAPGPVGTPITLLRPVQYVQLLPGQTAPPGATVIDAAAPTPITIVTTIQAPAQQAAVIRTTQSGKVIP